MFFSLAYRLPAYTGALAAVAAQQREGQPDPGRRGAPSSSQGYERNSGRANNARTAQTAPPATAASIRQHNAQLGGWFGHRVNPSGGVSPDLREAAQAEYPELREPRV